MPRIARAKDGRLEDRWGCYSQLSVERRPEDSVVLCLKHIQCYQPYVGLNCKTTTIWETMCCTYEYLVPAKLPCCRWYISTSKASPSSGLGLVLDAIFPSSLPRAIAQRAIRKPFRQVEDCFVLHGHEKILAILAWVPMPLLSVRVRKQEQLHREGTAVRVWLGSDIEGHPLDCP